MCPFRFQNCLSPTPLTSTMLVEVTTGVSGFGRGRAEQSGMTKRSRFSYSAKRRSRRGGTLLDLCVSAVVVEDTLEL